MKTLIFTSLLVLLLCCVPSAIAIVTDHQVEISSTSTGLSVTEDITIQNNEEPIIDTLDFWVQQGTNDFSISLVEGNIELSPIKEGNVYNVNLTQEDINISTGDSKIFRLTYMLDSTVEYFEKTVKMDTSLLTIMYNTRELYHGESLLEGAHQRVRLYVPSEAPLNTLYIGLIFILVVLLILLMLLLMRKQRKKAKKGLLESEELLSSKKALLLSTLKDIEKKHRAKEISDETYAKLKDEFKQQAVNVMKKLDDIGIK